MRPMTCSAPALAIASAVNPARARETAPGLCVAATTDFEPPALHDGRLSAQKATANSTELEQFASARAI